MSVADEVHCSKKTELKPGIEVTFWGYRSDGAIHVWEKSSKYVLEGPADTSPNNDCGNYTPVEPEDPAEPE